MQLVMPQPLANNRAGSEPQGFGVRPTHQQLAAMYGRDQAANLTDRLPEPKSAYDVPRTHGQYVPPEYAVRAVSGGIEDVQGPRYSALGLEGIDPRTDTKAPTVRPDQRSWYA